MREAEGDDVQETLHLVDDSICEGEGLPVLHFGAAVSDHAVDFLLHLFCTREIRRIPSEQVLLMLIVGGVEGS